MNYSTDRTSSNASWQNRIIHNATDASTANDRGIDNFFSASTTPAYAHSFLLTAKLTPDYQDLTGDGVSPDDVGNAWKFDYTRTSSAYKWRIPYEDDSFMEGYLSNGPGPERQLYLWREGIMVLAYYSKQEPGSRILHI